MRNPRPDAFDPKAHKRQPDPVDLTGVVPILPKVSIEKEIYHASPASGVEPTREDVVSRYQGVMTPPVPDAALKIEQAELMKTVRKAVKEFGKEAATYRFTVTEKKALGEIVFAYRGQGIRTSENEITRIAINFLFNDYKLNGQNSILHKILVALNE